MAAGTSRLSDRGDLLPHGDKLHVCPCPFAMTVLPERFHGPMNVGYLFAKSTSKRRIKPRSSLELDQYFVPRPCDSGTTDFLRAERLGLSTRNRTTPRHQLVRSLELM